MSIAIVLCTPICSFHVLPGITVLTATLCQIVKPPLASILLVPLL